jgi:hypothetical protein
MLYRLVPKSAPLTVMLLPPVVPRFITNTAETELESYDPASVNDPDASPAVIDTRRLPSTPAAALQTAELSDTHSVACAPVHPARSLLLYRLVPKSAPLTVMLLPPVVP